MTKLCIALGMLAACGSSGSKNPGGTTDAPGGGSDSGNKVYLDAPGNVPATITVSGNAAEQGLGSSTPQAGVAIAAYAPSDETTALATATTDAQGNYTLAITTHGAPVDLFVKASKASYMDTYLYPAAPLVADTPMSDVNMITPSNFSSLSTFAGGNQMSGKGVIALAVLDGSGMPVTGATVSSDPASNPYRYDGSGGIPSSTATSTSSDGYAYMFNVPGQVTITASKSGATFKSHAVDAHPDAFTQTVVTE
ncbi:MAG TPA: hypothetical protein VLX92_19810 [Kofleriaceae bacterium]|nr:hypothetical protein [Kofleriaceae bacterium]